MFSFLNVDPVEDECPRRILIGRGRVGRSRRQCKDDQPAGRGLGWRMMKRIMGGLGYEAGEASGIDGQDQPREE